uniref:Uncharacterized protein n=1 Tax=Haplochromis burtoni TaxID=8153 RepID=A0A3Q2VPI2_HAPBU
MHGEAKHQNWNRVEEHDLRKQPGHYDVLQRHKADKDFSSNENTPLTGDDPPCTVLSVLDTAEPITAIFMGFQSALDESRQVREFEGSLKAELVIVEDDEDYDDSNMKEKKSHGHIPKPSASNGAAAQVQGLGDGHRESAVGPGVRKIWKKQQPCCSVC